MRTILILLAFCALILQDGKAQYRTYTVHPTSPKITHGPILMAPADSGISILWTTDTPAHSRVVYGTGDSLDLVAEPQTDGLLPVDTVHAIRLTGLKPGARYRYRVESTGVTDLKAYWPEKTLAASSPEYSFTMPDANQDRMTLSFITDTQHEDLARLGKNLDLVDWKKLEFLVHGGDALNWVRDQEQVFDNFLDPINERLGSEKPLVFTRGNHEMRGPFARAFKRYVPNGTGRYYYTFDAGPVHFIILDTGEDKADTTSVYAGLNRVLTYREEEFSWFKQHVASSSRVKEAPFRILIMHAPAWGWVNGEYEKWTALANEAGIDLVIGGHNHRFARVAAGAHGNEFPVLIVDQDQVAEVDVNRREIRVVVKAKDGTTADSFTLEAKKR